MELFPVVSDQVRKRRLRSDTTVMMIDVRSGIAECAPEILEELPRIAVVFTSVVSLIKSKAAFADQEAPPPFYCSETAPVIRSGSRGSGTSSG